MLSSWHRLFLVHLISWASCNFGPRALLFVPASAGSYSNSPTYLYPQCICIDQLFKFHRYHKMPLSFLDLPRELRDQIYSDVLSPTGFIALYHPRNLIHVRIASYSLTQRGFSAVNLALLRTCKQIANESRGLLWKLNSFHWLSSRPLQPDWWQIDKIYQVQSVCLALAIQNVTSHSHLRRFPDVCMNARSTDLCRNCHLRFSCPKSSTEA